jgi:DNA helicase-2/ATP-dependent DNA helicase PcrA
MEEALRKRNIPYKIYGGFSFYQRKEIKDLLAYLRLISNPKDNEALKRIINFPLRGIGKTSIEKLEVVANFNSISVWEVVEQINLVKEINAGTKKKLQKFYDLMHQFMLLAKEKDAYEVALSVAQEVGILKALQEQNTPESISQHENILELLNGIKDYASLLIEEEGIEKLTLDKYLENVALITSQDNEKEEDKDKVTLMTIHSAKGLEFRDIHVVGVEQDLFPSMMSKNNPKDLEEERRLFYVAITRAEKQLTISYAMSRMKYGKFAGTGPSFFLNEIDAQFTDNEIKTSFFNKQTKATTVSSSNNRFNKSYNQRAKLKPLNQFSSDFVASPSNQIQAGAHVLHERFGKGKVLQVNNNNGNKVAVIFFENVGQKNLLLKFAKLKVVE